MRVLLLGNRGQLGWELERTLSPLGELVAVDFPQIDLSKPEGLRPLIRNLRPQVIVNATAYTAVDRAESEPEIAMAINGDAPGAMAEEACALKAALIHYSTDYVFSGDKGIPYLETDTPDPLGVYGSSKLAGEQVIQEMDGCYLILRTAWVYSLRKDSFVTKVLQWSRTQRTLKLVTDQVSNPTWCRALAEVTAQVLAQGSRDITAFLSARRGLYHLAGSGYSSRLKWGQAILRLDPHPQEQITKKILPALTADFPTPAQRPLFSALDCRKFSEAFGLNLPGWETSLSLAMAV